MASSSSPGLRRGDGRATAAPAFGTISVIPAEAGIARGYEKNPFDGPGRRADMRGGYTYVVTNKPFSVLYVGVTAGIAERMLAHREGRGSAFCRKWALTRLVLIEPHPTIEDAIRREKALKNWPRVWKLRLISEANPEWHDLFETLNA